MNTEETKTEQTESPTFAQRIESITNEWKESILQDAHSIVTEHINNVMDEIDVKTETDIENIVESVIENSSDLDYKIEGYIDDYDMDDKIERWADYNLDVEDKVDDVLRYYDWDNVMDEIDTDRLLRRMKDGVSEQVADMLEQAKNEDDPMPRIESIEGRIEAILDMLQNLSTTLFHQVNDIHSRGDA